MYGERCLLFYCLIVHHFYGLLYYSAPKKKRKQHDSLSGRSQDFGRSVSGEREQESQTEPIVLSSYAFRVDGNLAIPFFQS